MPEIKTCNRVLPDQSVCGSTDMAANHSWCKACKSAYQKAYEKERLDIMERRGFARGAAAQRELLVQKCKQVGNYAATGFTFATWMQGERTPEFTPVDLITLP